MTHRLIYHAAALLSKESRSSLAAPSVEGWQRRIEGLEREVAEVMQEEREERALRKAEQEATKVWRTCQVLSYQFVQHHVVLNHNLFASRNALPRCRITECLALRRGFHHVLQKLPSQGALQSSAAFKQRLRAGQPFRKVPDGKTLPGAVVQAMNMIEHEEDIYARPARTWFQVHH